MLPTLTRSTVTNQYLISFDLSLHYRFSSPDYPPRPPIVLFCYNTISFLLAKDILGFKPASGSGGRFKN
ncbi:hypothetical protein C5167_001207 [Papaver somniferum]|uniref:Uncharacterized protein n=1 Tax=Papaver somniferum TaxID=3469 RepID=A0A4Y7KYQ7_PAPSO|nr:hypothetical protein C5167_001207 [Papaver somniferum]